MRAIQGSWLFLVPANPSPLAVATALPPSLFPDGQGTPGKGCQPSEFCMWMTGCSQTPALDA